jgi:hypothetical protein
MITSLRQTIAQRNKKLKMIRESGVYTDDFYQKARDDSLDLILNAYVAEIIMAKTADERKLSEIKMKYDHPEDPSTLFVMKDKFRAMSDAQLKSHAQTQGKEASPLEMRAIGAEMRNRASPEMLREADTIATFIEGSHLDEKWRNDTDFKYHQQRAEKWKILESQAENMICLTDDPNSVPKDCIILLDKIDEVI